MADDEEEINRPLSIKEVIKTKHVLSKETILYSVQPKYYNEGSTESFKLLTMRERLKEYDDDINNKEMKSYLITILYDTETSYSTSWENVRDIAPKTCNLLMTTDILEVFMATYTIEHVHTIPKGFEDEPESVKNQDKEKEKRKKEKCKDQETKEKEKKKEKKEEKKEKEKEETAPIKKRNRKFYQIHDFKSLDGCMEKSKITYLKDIDKMEYTCALHNIVTLYLYSQNLIEKDDEFLEYLYDMQIYTGKLMDDGIPYKFPVEEKINKSGKLVNTYSISRELYMAHMQIQIGLTTVGYPHIHISILTESSSDYATVIKKLTKLVKDVSGLINVKVDRHKHDPPYPTESLMYVIKNHASRVVRNSLDRSFYAKKLGEELLEKIKIAKRELWTKKRTNEWDIAHRIKWSKERAKDYSKICPIIRAYISERSKYKTGLYKMLKMISYREDIDNFSSNKAGRNKTIGMEIVLSHNIEVERLTYILHNLPISINDFKLLDPEIHKQKYRFLNKIQKHMLKNGYVLCDEMIYKYYEGTKTTFKIAQTEEPNVLPMTIEIFLQSLKGRTGWEKLPVNEIAKMMRNPTCLNTDDDEISIDFPRIKINYRMIEFKDFYFCLNTRKIFRTQTKYFTYRYCGVSFANRHIAIKKIIDESVWSIYIKASNINTIQDLGILYNCILDRRNIKDGTISLFGASNSGKTRMIKPFQYIFPEHLVGHLTSISEHHVYYQMRGKLMVVVDEVNTIVRSLNAKDSKDRAIVLAALEANVGIANKKLGDIIACDHSKSGLITTGNDEAEDEMIFKSDVILNRMSLIHLKKGACELALKKYIDKGAHLEGPVIMLLCAMCNIAHINNLDYLPDLEVFPDLHDEDIELIENSTRDFSFDSRELIKADDGENITYFSLQAEIKPRISFSEQRFEHTTLPDVRFENNSEIASELSNLAKKCKFEAIKMDVRNRNVFDNELRLAHRTIKEEDIENKRAKEEADNTDEEDSERTEEDHQDSQNINNKIINDSKINDSKIKVSKSTVEPITERKINQRISRSVFTEEELEEE